MNGDGVQSTGPRRTTPGIAFLITQQMKHRSIGLQLEGDGAGAVSDAALGATGSQTVMGLGSDAGCAEVGRGRIRGFAGGWSLLVTSEALRTQALIEVQARVRRWAPQLGRARRAVLIP